MKYQIISDIFIECKKIKLSQIVKVYGILKAVNGT